MTKRERTRIESYHYEEVNGRVTRDEHSSYDSGDIYTNKKAGCALPFFFIIVPGLGGLLAAAISWIV